MSECVSEWIVPVYEEPGTCRAYRVKRIGDGYAWAHRCGLQPGHDGDHELAEHLASSGQLAPE